VIGYAAEREVDFVAFRTGLSSDNKHLNYRREILIYKHIVDTPTKTIHNKKDQCQVRAPTDFDVLADGPVDPCQLADAKS